jgi:hypothetical protein
VGPEQEEADMNMMTAPAGHVNGTLAVGKFRLKFCLGLALQLR